MDAERTQQAGEEDALGAADAAALPPPNSPARRPPPTREQLSLAPLAASALKVSAHGAFVDWLSRARGVLAVSTYNSGKLAVISADSGRLHVACWKFARPMGLAYHGDRLAVVARGGVLPFRQRTSGGCAYFGMGDPFVTGLVDAHDAAWGRRGLYFANTRFNCIARTTHRVRFLRVWQPQFISGVVASDACHLNGLAMQSGLPRLATAFCESSQPKGWKQEDRFTAGVAVDVVENKVVARGFCMPHSPRRFAGQWWLCNSGDGTLCNLDVKRGQWSVVAALPGFTRGLCHVGRVAVVGMSRIRAKHILDAPPVRERCGIPIAGVAAVEIHSGRTIGWLNFRRGGSEVYDVAFLPDVSRVEFCSSSDAKAITSPLPA